MPNDLLDLLSRDDVPKSPRGLSKQVHDRLNPRLLALHLAEFAVAVVPFAFFHFLKAMAGAFVFTLTGDFQNEGEDHAE